MPIMLDDVQNAISQPMPKVYSPKFFDSKLTGTGKKIGVLNMMLNPSNCDPNRVTTSENTQTRKRKYVNGQTSVSLIPINVLTYDAWAYMQEVERPDLADMTKIAVAKAGAGHPDVEVYVHMPVHSIVLEETQLQLAQGSSTSRKCTPCYQMMVYAVEDPASALHMQCSNVPSLARSGPKGGVNLACAQKNLSNGYYSDFTCNPLKTLNEITDQLAQYGFAVDQQAVADFIANYDLYSGVQRRSEEWQTTIDKTLDKFFENVTTCFPGSKSAMDETIFVLRRIEDYNIPLDLYRVIYANVKARFSPDDATMLCKHNLNLLLSDTLNNLEQNKPQLTHVTAPVPPAQVPMNLARFSPEQQKAVTSEEPLVLVQAGAGTGKSTVILGRIEYMCACGINPQDITVLSFTNAAANHITDMNPNVHSMTIARMIHNIYTANFKHHELSSIDTIVNSIDIYYHGNDIADKFKYKCRAIIKKESDAFTSLNNFIEAHYDEVIDILNTIGQTSLELEIIICYQKIDSFVEPPEVQSKYLIIDEVQDNSIFEFIYTIKYVDKHKESLFIVGDCSQTLYEFRSSNPKALNVLEGSGVFAAYQLQVNYRSNQEILDFANVLLRNIEANQYASIQLQANAITTVTEQSFTDKVHFKYHQVAKISDMKDALPIIFGTDIKPYVQDCLSRKEQVAFLAYTRNDVYKMQAILKDMFPTAALVNLVPEKIYNTTIFSEFIKRYWAEVQFIPTTSITVVIAQEIVSRLGFLVHAPDKMLPVVQRMLANWRSENQTIIDSWQRQHMAGRLSLDDFLNNVKESMLQFEIRSNAIRQALVSSRNEEQKKAQNSANADLILSTIHSAKGLEFDNVVVIYRNKNDLEESEKRMYYVAFTRAMKSEFIVAWDTVKNPRIESDYKTIVDHLHKTHPAPPPVQPSAIAQQAQQAMAAGGQAQATGAAQPAMDQDDAFDMALQGAFQPNVNAAPAGPAPAQQSAPPQKGTYAYGPVANTAAPTDVPSQAPAAPQDGPGGPSGQDAQAAPDPSQDGPCGQEAGTPDFSDYGFVFNPAEKPGDGDTRSA